MASLSLVPFLEAVPISRRGLKSSIHFSECCPLPRTSNPGRFTDNTANWTDQPTEVELRGLRSLLGPGLTRWPGQEALSWPCETGICAWVCGPTTRPRLVRGCRYRIFFSIKSMICLTSVLVWWYSGHTYFLGEGLHMRLATPTVSYFRSLFSRAIVPVLVLALAAFVAAAPVFSQGSTGLISGSITDQSGGNIRGATIVITDVARGVKTNLVADSDGNYVALGLLPGTYSMHVDAKGFKAFERQNILLEVGKEIRVDAVLQPGTATEVVTVTETLPMVDTSTTTLGGTISNEIINDLPLNGRNYQNLLTLRPGTTIYPGGGPWTQSTDG